MTGLDAAIRARLDDLRHRADLVAFGLEDAVDALFAVLDRHQPDPKWTDTPRCKTCLTDRVGYQEDWDPEAWPCGELHAIADALGVEVPGA